MNENESWFNKYGKWVCLFLGSLVALSFAFLICKTLGTQAATLSSQAKMTLLFAIGMVAIQLSTGLDWIVFKAEKQISDGHYAEARKLIERLMFAYKVLRPTAPDRARLLVLLGGCQLAMNDTIAAKRSLTEAVDMIRQIKQSALWLVGADSVLAEQINQVFDQRFRSIEGVANLELAALYQRTGETKDAVALCRGAIDSLQEYRSDMVRQMTRQEVSKRKLNQGDRWTVLSRAVSKSEKLAGIEQCIEGAYDLARSLSRI